MSRRLRFIPEGGALVEVTHRALHSRLLFRPGPLLNQIIIGTLARAKRRYKVRVCFFVAASNHLHLYLDVDDAEQLSRFMGYFGSKLAREVGRLFRVVLTVDPAHGRLSTFCQGGSIGFSRGPLLT